MRIGTVGTGLIVDTFLSALADVDGVSCVAMYSRKQETAKPLADKFAIQKVYTNLLDMYQDEEIDTIYLASPNSLHYDQAYQALEQGKHVIIEKPFTATVEETKSLIQLAKSKQLMLFEAISNIYLPNIEIVKNHIDLLGPIKIVQCNYTQLSSRYFKLLDGELPNIFNPNFAGGVLGDLNIYNIHLVVHLFDKPDQVRYTANLYIENIDTSGVVTMKYPDFTAICTASKDSEGDNAMLIQGEKGFIKIPGNSNACSEVILSLNGKETRLNAQTNDNRLYSEVKAFQAIFEENNLEACYEKLNHTLNVMDVYVAARKDAGIVYPADDN